VRYALAKGQHTEGKMLIALVTIAVVAVVITGLVILSAMQDINNDY